MYNVMPGASSDPLELGELDPDLIEAEVARKELEKKAKKAPTQLEVEREARLRDKESRISSGRKQKQPDVSFSVPPSAPPPPEPEDLSKLLDRLEMYHERFPWLKSRNKITARSLPQEIHDELHYVEVQLGSGGEAGGFAPQVFVGVMSALEIGTRDYFNPLKLNLSGLSSVAKDNIDQFTPLIDEMSIKYGAGMYMPVEWRLAIAVGTLCATVHAANSGDPKLASVLQRMNQPVQTPASGSDL